MSQDVGGAALGDCSGAGIRRRVDRDRGAATVVACVGAVVLLVMTGLAVRVGAAVLARQRAETGADLAALAGAAQMLRGAEVACAAAGVVARANDVVVSGCRTDGLDLLVEVTAEVGGSLGGSAVGRARAGPVTSIEGTELAAHGAGDGVDAVPPVLVAPSRLADGNSCRTLLRTVRLPGSTGEGGHSREVRRAGRSPPRRASGGQGRVAPTERQLREGYVRTS